MSSVKSRSSLRSLVLTPDRIPSFFIPSSNPLIFTSPQPQQPEQDRTRLLSDHDETPPSASSSPRVLIRPRSSAAKSADMDLTTRAAMSLSHIPKVTTPYGFSAVLAASPCTNRRESLFHRNRPVMETVTEAQEAVIPSLSGSGSDPSKFRFCFQPVKALGVQVMKELRRPAAALKARSPAARATAHR